MSTGRFPHQIVRLRSRFFPTGRFSHQIARLGMRFFPTGRFSRQIARLGSRFFPAGRFFHQIARLGSRFLSTGRSFHLMVPPYIRFFWSSSKIIPLPLPSSQYAEIVYDSCALAPGAAQKTRPPAKQKGAFGSLRCHMYILFSAGSVKFFSSILTWDRKASSSKYLAPAGHALMQAWHLMQVPGTFTMS